MDTHEGGEERIKNGQLTSRLCIHSPFCNLVGTCYKNTPEGDTLRQKMGCMNAYQDYHEREG